MRLRAPTNARFFNRPVIRERYMDLFPRRRATHAPRLGELEIEMMELVWRDERVTARAALECLSARTICLSTVQTTLERLTRKGLLRRERHGRAFVYVVQIQRAELLALLMHDLAQEFATGRFEPLLSGFQNLVDQLNPERAKAALDTLRERLGSK